MYFSTKVNATLRTKEFVEECAKKLAEDSSLNQVTLVEIFEIISLEIWCQRLSILTFVPFFDIIKGCPIDSLHCIWEGVVKQFCSLWFDSSNHKYPWYIGKPEILGKTL